MSAATRVAAWRTEDSGWPYEPFLIPGRDIGGLRAAFRATGVAVFGAPALDADIHQRLLAEARTQQEVASWELRGAPGVPGELPQDSVRAQLGPVARELVAAGATRALLAALTGHVVIPGWSATCMTYYDRAGMYLGAHRDKQDACQYAILLYLDARWPAGQEPGPGLQLHVRDHADREVAMRITAHPNRLIVLHGARLTHYRPPLADGESMCMLNGCYAVADTPVDGL